MSKKKTTKTTKKTVKKTSDKVTKIKKAVRELEYNEDTLRSTLIQVFKNFVNHANDMEELNMIKDGLDAWLDELSSQDYFGTENQSDPRGDGRNIDGLPKI